MAEGNETVFELAAVTILVETMLAKEFSSNRDKFYLFRDDLISQIENASMPEMNQQARQEYTRTLLNSLRRILDDVEQKITQGKP